MVTATVLKVDDTEDLVSIKTALESLAVTGSAVIQIKSGGGVVLAKVVV